jgi:glycosyltransferase involved in cell wall biosynthesis
MLLKPLHILVISPESWGISFLSKHHYAMALCEMGHRVWFLNSPYGPTADLKQPHERLKVLDDRWFIKGLRHLPKFVQRRLMRRQIHQLKTHIGVDLDLIWSFDNSRYFHLDLFQALHTIHHVVDDHMDYQLSYAASSADLCIGVTSNIVNRLKKHNAHCLLIPHGIKGPILSHAGKIPLASYKLHAAYVGNLLMRTFDAALMLELVQAHKDIGFWLIGNYTPNHLSLNLPAQREDILQQLRLQPNVYFYGECPPDEAFALAAEASILLSMYFENGRCPDNSSKVMPYLASGKIIVSNHLAAYDGSDLLLMCKTRDAYLSLFAAAKEAIEGHNSPELQASRKEFAAKHSYDQLIKQIFERL